MDVHRSKYTEDQIKYVQECLSEWAYYYGYADVQENPTGFFFKGEQHKEECLAKFNQFKIDNIAAIERVSSETYEPTVYWHNHGPNRRTFLDEEDLGGKIFEPGLDYAKKTL